MEEAKLYTRPERPPTLVCAAVTHETARWAGEWADALITVSQPDEVLNGVLAAFRETAGPAKPAFLQVHLAYDPDPDRARETAFREWRANVGDNSVVTELRTPDQLAKAARHVRPEDVAQVVRISSDLGQHRAWLERDLEPFDSVYLHEVGRDQRRFVEVFGAEVLPAVRPAQ